jgi:hypothetical protein
MPHLFTKIEIAAPPSIVRERFLQFEQIPTYSPNGFFKWVGPAEKNAPLEPGTRMHNVLEGMVIDPIILVSSDQFQLIERGEQRLIVEKENSEKCFRWRGTWHEIFTGEHSFRFEQSENLKGGTTFIHEEVFSGLLGSLMGEGPLAKMLGFREKTKRGFEGFNGDFKTWVEGSGGK